MATITPTRESPVAYLPQMITPQEAAAFLHVSDRTVLTWIERNRIPYVTLPGGTERATYRIPLSGLVSSLSGTFDLAGAIAEGEAHAAALGQSDGDLRRIAVEASRED